MSAAREIQKQTILDRTPVFQATLEAALAQVRCRTVFPHVREAHSPYGRIGHQFLAVESQWSVYLDLDNNSSLRSERLMTGENLV